MEHEVAGLARSWFDAWRTKDAGAIERMMAAEYVYVAPNGAVRDDLAAHIRPLERALRTGIAGREVNASRPLAATRPDY